ncbi:DUF4256 domain-containing protein [Candidatus Peregrinibacteria bacterium]|nr:DUF4256 domain-containing protein [Candidatus Peregrinibacteria bacterium]
MSSIDSTENTAVKEVVTAVCPEVRIAAAQVILSEADVEVSEVLRDRRDETFALVQRLLASAGIQVTFSTSKAEQSEKIVVEIPEARQPEVKSSAEVKKELTQEQKEQLFADLRTYFEADRNLHPSLKWEDVAQKLKNSSEATLVTLHKMQARGGQPTVTDFDEKTGKYRFDDCSKEIPLEGRNTTYLEAEKMAQDLGADLMEPEHYKNKFQKLDKQFDLNSFNWLKTTEENLQAGYAFDGFRHEGVVVVGPDSAVSHDVRKGFRASLWV